MERSCSACSYLTLNPAANHFERLACCGLSHRHQPRGELKRFVGAKSVWWSHNHDPAALHCYEKLVHSCSPSAPEGANCARAGSPLPCGRCPTRAISGRPRSLVLSLWPLTGCAATASLNWRQRAAPPRHKRVRKQRRSTLAELVPVNRHRQRRIGTTPHRLGVYWRQRARVERAPSGTRFRCPLLLSVFGLGFRPPRSGSSPYCGFPLTADYSGSPCPPTLANWWSGSSLARPPLCKVGDMPVALRSANWKGPLPESP